METTEANENVTEDNTASGLSTTSTASSKYPLALDGTWSIVLYVVIGTVGIMGNSFAIFILSTSTSIKKRMTTVLLINQSVVDLLCSVLVALNSYSSKALGSLHVTMGLDLYCKLIGSGIFLWGFIVSSTWNLVFINTERYLSVVFPIFHKTKLRKRHLIILAGVVGIFGPIYDIILFVPTSTYSVDWNNCAIGTVVPSQAVGTLMGVINISVQMFIPVGLMIFFYKSMFLSIRKVNTQGSTGVTTHTKSRNVLKTLAIVTLTFMFCWLPNSTLYLLYLIGVLDASIFSHPFYQFTEYLLFCNSSINPIIYTAQYKDFQDQIKRVFLKSKLEETSSTVSTVNSHTGELWTVMETWTRTLEIDILYKCNCLNVYNMQCLLLVISRHEHVQSCTT